MGWFDSLFASKPKTATTQSNTTQTVAPIAGQADYWQKLWDSANAAFGQTQGKTYTGQYVAGPTDAQQQGVQAMLGLAGRAGAGETPTRTLAQNTINGLYMNPETNSYLSGAVTAANKNVLDQLKLDILPQISDKAISQGAFGGARQDLQQDRAVSNFSDAATRNAQNIYYQNYATERQNQLNAPQLFQSADTQGMTVPNILMGAGGQQQQWEQDKITNALKAFEESTAAPWRGMSELANILQAGGFKTSTGDTTQTGTVQQASNPMTSLLQGLVGGAGVGQNLATSVGGVAAGAGLGAFAPWMIPAALLGGATSFLGAQ